MITWVIPKDFCCGLICSGVLQNLNTTTILHARLVYISLCLFFGTLALIVKIFAQDIYNKLSFCMPNCHDMVCFSNHVTYAIMMSLSIFNFSILIITLTSTTLANSCYLKCWPLKFVFYFITLFICILAASALDYYFLISVPFLLIFLFVQSVYLIELNYDWNDTWYEKYSQGSSEFWGMLLISFSVICWILTICMLMIAYIYTKYFIINLIGFGISVMITIFSSSPLCQNGSLLSSSLTIMYANYYLTSALVVDYKEENYLVLGLDAILSLVSLGYLAFIVPDKVKADKHVQINQTEMKSFRQNRELEESKIDENEVVEKFTFNNTLFQSVLGCFCFYIGMILTNWQWDFSKNTHMVAKCIQAAMVFGFYVWTLIAPIIIPEKEFNR
ncbi:hypothetical protein SteCoe_27403 [Stentor coeruleus]|uniref:Uncharacterized protein n=1 Tax=Stentor coeruleus TaxID=5963 RepID=A0A1R2BAJ1_9CILI|nr:hypothetical protein SteCoe_27403 [Stentor coeruleus]